MSYFQTTSEKGEGIMKKKHRNPLKVRAVLGMQGWMVDGVGPRHATAGDWSGPTRILDSRSNHQHYMQG